MIWRTISQMPAAVERFEDVPSSSSSNARDPWWEGKLALLVIGFVLTGVLGSGLEILQKRLEWRRQMTFQSFNRKLAAMQKARADLTKVYVAVMTLEEQMDGAINHPDKAGPGFPIAGKVREAMRQDRLQQTANLYLSAEAFQDPGAIKLKLQPLITTWINLIELRDALEQTRNRSALPDIPRKLTAIGVTFGQQYDRVHVAMESQIGHFEDDHKNFDF